MLRRIRIPVQLAALGLFLYLLVRTLGVGEDRLGPPVRIFLEIDPLIGLTTWLRTHALPGLLWLSLLTLGLSFVLGRAFCGWICPLGTLSQIAGRLGRARRDEKAADRYRPAQRWKYALLLFLLGGAVSGAAWSGIFDPLSILIRGLALGLGPGLEVTIRGVAAALAATPLAGASEPLYRAVRDHLLAPNPPHYEQGMLLLALLVLLLGLSWTIRRFWCRTLCPLGALLGAVAQGGALTLRQDADDCSGCTVCTFHCQGAADPDVAGGWRAAECFVCGNCTASCHRGGLAFAFTAPRAWTWIRRALARPRMLPVARRREGADMTRRALLASFGLGLLTGPLAQASPSRRAPRATLIRPPGAGPEAEFLDRCIRCGECMKVCPANGLHPAGFEAGAAGLWAPALRPRLGYCEYHCTLCGQVCPTGAIPELTMAAKEKAVLGLAWVDPGLCLPFAFATPCIVCEEHCPTSPKAIVLEDIVAEAADGTQRAVRRPRIDPVLCVGCGVCEFVCPVPGRAAIRITGTGRTRRENPLYLGF